jgi:glycine betaine catabolism B
MNSLTFWLQKTTMYRLMLHIMLVLLLAAVFLSAAGILPYDARSITLQVIFLTGICWGSNAIIARALNIQPNTESSLITGLILTALAGPLALPRDWPVIVVMAISAIGSKYLLTIKRSHVFNPAAFGAVASALILGYPASWWVGSRMLMPVILLGGVLMMAKMRRWHLVGSFLGVYLGLMVLEALLIQGRSLAETVLALRYAATSASLLFFAFVMLIEPLTAPQTTARRTVFGVFTAIALFVLQRLFLVPYSLEAALLAGNIFARFIDPDFRQALVLARKEFLTPALGSFWFEPTRRFSFAPGQFLEYTVAHSRPDTRGVRRYFTIASSPTEPQILLAARFSRPGSTFKQALKNKRKGDEVVASKVAGDFVLPPDSARKLAFIAGGIGITPFRSMVKYLLDTNQPRDIVLLYGARAEEELIFRDIFEEAQMRFGMRVVYVISRLIDKEAIRKEVPDFTTLLFYVSGPEPMVQGVSKILAGMGIARRQIKRDYFPGYAEL